MLKGKKVKRWAISLRGQEVRREGRYLKVKG